jgi:hypothetical protein
MDQAEMAVQSPAPYAILLAAGGPSMSPVLFCAFHAILQLSAEFY